MTTNSAPAPILPPHFEGLDQILPELDQIHAAVNEAREIIRDTVGERRLDLQLAQAGILLTALRSVARATA